MGRPETEPWPETSHRAVFYLITSANGNLAANICGRNVVVEIDSGSVNRDGGTGRPPGRRSKGRCGSLLLVRRSLGLV